MRASGFSYAILLDMPEEEKLPTLEELRSKDLTPALIARETRPRPTWFVKRLMDGVVIAVHEKEAWDMLYNQSNWKRHDFQFVGFSDGKTYQKMTKEALMEANRLVPEIDAKKKEIARYVALEDRLMIDEIIDLEGDPEDAVNEANKGKLKRLQAIRTRLDAELEALEKQHNSATADIVRRATAAELKVAQANWKREKVWPRDDINILTPAASPKERNKIIKTMNGGM